MFEHNKPFAEFRDKLKARGVGMLVAWETKRSPQSTQPDVALIIFTGEGFATAIKSAVLVDYGSTRGYGIWMESMTHNIDEDVRRIVGEPDAD